MRITDGTIERVRAAADIVDIVSGFVRLRKAGRNFVGLCPFHKEKTPSFNVNPERNIYKCFGCGKGGDPIGFIMDIESVSFLEAVEELADRYGIAIDREGTQPTAEKREDIEALYDATRLAAHFFHDTLQSEAGAIGREYYKRRQWTVETQRAFGLGFAPSGWSGLLDHLRGEGVDMDIMEKAGLVVRKEGGRNYDRFRNRVVFPIIHVTRKVVGFGARALSPEDEPKYLNSPDSVIYNKSRVLYGLSQASSAIRERDAVIVVEGYADVISMHQAGVRNTVSTSGTALTPDQVHMLRRYTRNIFFLYDADSAGIAAMLRGLDVILAEDCDARVVRLPAGEDPDSYVLKFGEEAVREQLGTAVSFVDFVTDRYKAEGRLDSPEGMASAVHHIVGMIAKMDDPIRREFYVRHIARKYGMYENVLFQELAKVLRGTKRGERPVRVEEAEEAPRAEERDAPLPKEERIFCSHLLLAPRDVQSEVLHSISIAHFRHPRIQRILHELFEQEEHEGAVNSNALWNLATDDAAMHTLLADLMMPRDEPNSDWSERQTVVDVDHRRVLCDDYRAVLRLRFDERRRGYMDALRVALDTETQLDLMRKKAEVDKILLTLNDIAGITELPDPDEE